MSYFKSLSLGTVLVSFLGGCAQTSYDGVFSRISRSGLLVLTVQNSPAAASTPGPAPSSVPVALSRQISSFNFESMELNKKAVATFYLQNVGELDASNLSLSIDSSAYRVGGNCPTVLKGGELATCIVEVSFSPQTSSPLLSKLKISYQDGAGVQVDTSIPFNGSGIAFDTPIVLKPTPTPSSTLSINPSPTVLPSASPSPNPTVQVSASPLPSASVVPTPSSQPTASPTPIPTVSASPQPTTPPSPIVTPSPSASPSPSPSPSSSSFPSASPTPYVCNALGSSGTNSSGGVAASLFVGNSTNGTTSSFRATGTLMNLNVFFGSINVPNQSWSTGFPLTQIPGGPVLNSPSCTTNPSYSCLPSDPTCCPLTTWFMLAFRGQLQLTDTDVEGAYQFQTVSDDGATFSILPFGASDVQSNYVNIINGDGVHGFAAYNSTQNPAYGTVTMRRGQPLAFVLDFFQGPPVQLGVVLQWRVNNGPWQTIPAKNYLLPSGVGSNPCAGP